MDSPAKVVYPPISYPSKITNVAITVECEDGRVIGSPWFDVTDQARARAYAQRKVNETSCVPRVIKQLNWREGDTLDTVQQVILPTLKEEPLIEAIEVSKRATGVHGVAEVIDEEGKKRFLPLRDVTMMQMAGKKIKVLRTALTLKELEK